MAGIIGDDWKPPTVGPKRHMLHIFYGADDFSVNEAVKELRAKVGSDGFADSNMSSLEGRQLTLAQLRAICDAFPFLAERRLVIVEGLLSRFTERRGRRGGQDSSGSSDLGEWSGLGEYIKAMPPTTELILTDGEIAKSHPLLKQVLGLGETREFQTLRKEKLEEWIKLRVAGQGGSITPGAVNALEDMVGGNLWALQSEIEKLCLYAGGRAISDNDVRTLVGQAREASVFAMVDGIVDGRTSVALQFMERLLGDGAEPPYIVSMIARQLRLLIQAREMVEQRVPDAEMKKRLEIRQDFAFEKLLRQARNHNPEEIKALYRRLLDADVAVKTGRMKDDLALELYVTEAGSRG